MGFYPFRGPDAPCTLVRSYNRAGLGVNHRTDDSAVSRAFEISRPALGRGDSSHALRKTRDGPNEILRDSAANKASRARTNLSTPRSNALISRRRSGCPDASLSPSRANRQPRESSVRRVMTSSSGTVRKGYQSLLSGGRVAFSYRKDMAAVAAGIEDRKTDTGKMKASSVELTALDLLRYPSAGRINHIATVLADLAGKIDPEKLSGLSVSFERPVVQRLGNLLEHLGHGNRAKPMWVKMFADKSPRWVELDRSEQI